MYEANSVVETDQNNLIIVLFSYKVYQSIYAFYSIRIFSKFAQTKKPRQTTRIHSSISPILFTEKKPPSIDLNERIDPTRKNLPLEIYRVLSVASQVEPPNRSNSRSRESRLARISNKTAAEVYTTALSALSVTMLTYRCAGYANGIRGHFGADSTTMVERKEDFPLFSTIRSLFPSSFDSISLRLIFPLPFTRAVIINRCSIVIFTFELLF